MSVVDRLPVPSVPTPDLPLAPGALKNAGLLLLAAIPATLVLPFLGIPLVLGAVGILFFYRDPARHPPSSGYVAPADGTVSVIEWDDGRVRLGTYLGVGDVHVIRSPVRGTVGSVRHEPGGHLPAFSKRSDRNEKVHVNYDGTDVTMIAGSVARRITPYVEAGAFVRRGDRVGHIAFGSRTDVLLPEGIRPEDLAVEPGESVTAGETVIVPADAFDRRGQRAAAGEGEADGEETPDAESAGDTDAEDRAANAAD